MDLGVLGFLLSNFLRLTNFYFIRNAEKRREMLKNADFLIWKARWPIWKARWSCHLHFTHEIEIMNDNDNDFEIENEIEIDIKIKDEIPVLKVLL